MIYETNYTKIHIYINVYALSYTMGRNHINVQCASRGFLTLATSAKIAGFTVETNLIHVKCVVKYSLSVDTLLNI